jgi:hypothetical protein
MLRSANVATPATAGMVVLPERDPPLALAPSARVKLPTKSVATFPNRSSADSLTGGRSGRPGNVFVGLTVNRSRLAGPGFAIAVKATRAADESADWAGSLMDDMAPCCPATWPRVQLTVAMPMASVVVLVADNEPWVLRVSPTTVQ